MKRIYSILLALCVSSMLSAQLSIWDGTDDVWTKGAGTESSPYLIESAQQLAFIASMVNGGVTTYQNTYFKLMTNIDLNNLTWVPIGESTTKCFKGHFDGNNKTICNANVAIWNYIYNGSISRLVINTRQLVGEQALFSIIEYCQHSGTSAMIKNALNTQLSHCMSRANINNTDVLRSAGLVDSAYNCTLKDCLVEGSILSMNNSFRETDFSADYRYYANLGTQVSAGGLVAISQNNNYVRCSSNCLINGSTGSGIYSSELTTYCAGLVGISCMDNIAYCSNTAVSSGKFNVSYKQLGTSGSYHYIINTGVSHSGIIGVNAVPSTSSNVNTTIKNSYTINDSIYVMNYGDYQIPKGGGQTGYYYYLKHTLAPSSQNTYTSKEKTEQAMKSASFPIVLNTDSTVFIKDVTPNVNDGYPIYVNQIYSVTDALTTIGFTTAQLLGHYYALNADSVGFEYKEKTDNTHWYQSVIGQASGNVITCDLSGLTTGTNYVYRVWVERGGVRYFGDVLSFKTLECSKTVTPLTASICQGEEYTFNGQQLKQSGAYRDTLVATNGCDSIIELTLTVMPTANIDKYDTIMVGESYDFYGEILTESGNYEHYIPMVNKCNLIILHLYVRQPNVTLTVNVNDPLMGSVEGAGSFEKYTERTIKAVPNEGYHFVQWNDGITTNPRTISLTQDTTFTAQFAINQYTISVTCNPQQGRIEGTSGVFEHGTSHNFEAIPNTGYHFIKWSDDVMANPRTIILTRDSILSAEFSINIYSVQFFGFNEELLDKQNVEHGSAAIAPEVPKIDHYDFVGWDKEFSNVTSDMDIHALYEENSEDFENINVNTLPNKMIIGGQVYIKRGDKIYTILGNEL